MIDHFRLIQRTFTGTTGAVPMLSALMSALIMITIIAGCGGTYDPNPVWPPEPEDIEKSGMVSEELMISAAHPLAVEAGLTVLEAGGNAIDAAVAVQMALNVVEPPESGIGGGAFLLYRDGATGNLSVFDGREVAPASAGSDRFVVGNWPLPLLAAVPTGLAVGVPGTLAMLHQAHSEWGVHPWHELFEPAITLADEGIPMPERLKRQIDGDPSLWLFGDIRRHLVHSRRADEPRLKNSELAQTFRDIAREGPDYFYRGELTLNMIDAAGSRWPGRSDLTLEDFDNYRPVKREALCREYRGWTVCGVPAPSSGGITLLQILGILEHFDLSDYAPGNPRAIHLIAEASRLAFADRTAWIGDPDFVAVPQKELLDPVYLSGRAAWIDTHRAMDEAHPGIPDPVAAEAWRSNAAERRVSVPYKHETTGTSHFSIVDRHGNAVAMTTSIEAPFGSRIMTNGFLLNNQLTDFTFQAEQNGFRSPNAVAPGKRPRSSMAPVMVFDEDGELRLIIGSRGGSRIIGYVVKTLIGVLDWELSLQDAIAMPNFLHRGRFLELEEGTAWSGIGDSLTLMGHQVRIRPLESGIHGIERVLRDPDQVRALDGSDAQHDYADDVDDDTGRWYWRGGADPRMEGAAFGGAE